MRNVYLLALAQALSAAGMFVVVLLGGILGGVLISGRLGEQRRGENKMSVNHFTVDHVHLATDKPFEDVTTAFELCHLRNDLVYRKPL